MAIGERIKTGAFVFGNWEADIPLGSGSNGKTIVYRLKRSHGESVEYCALKAISLTEEYGSLEQLSAEQQNEYGEILFEKTKKAKGEIAAMEGLRGSGYVVTYLEHTFIDWASEDRFGRDLYIRMELLKDLRHEIKENRIFSENEIIKIGCDICKALIICHSKGIIHRDIKPDNIFYSRDGNYKLGDFGISKSLADPIHGYAGTGIGTFAYLPAEQLKGKYNKLVDIYSLGLVLYELSNGNKLPFAQSRYTTDQEVIKRLSGEALPMPSNASAELGKVILKACAFHPKERYASAEEFLAALEGISNPPVENPPLDKPAKFLSLMMICILAFGLIGYSVWNAVTRASLKSAITETIAETTTPTVPTLPSDTTETTIPKETKPVRIVDDPDRIVSIDASDSHIVAAYADGTVDAIALTKIPDRYAIRKWTDIESVSAGAQHTVGLRPDGTVVATGDNFYGECNVSDWSDIVKITAGEQFTAGLKSDGTVVYTGYNDLSKEFDVSKVSGVIDIDASESGRALDCLLSDGTWIRLGHLGGGEWVIDDKTYMTADIGADEDGYVSKEGNITSISTGSACSVGLKSDGTVELVQNLTLQGYSGYYKPDFLKPGAFNASKWKDITAVSAGSEHVVGLRKDGTVVFTGPLNTRYKKFYDVSSWSGITSIFAGSDYTFGLTRDGTILAAGMTYIDDGEWEQLDVSSLNRKKEASSDGIESIPEQLSQTDEEGFTLFDNSDRSPEELCILGYKTSNGMEIENQHCYSNESMVEIGFTWKDNTTIGQTLNSGGGNRDYSLEMIEDRKSNCIPKWEKQPWFGSGTPELSVTHTFSSVPQETYYVLLLSFDKESNFTAYTILKIGFPSK